VYRAGALADQQAAAIPDRQYIREEGPPISPKESRYADHGGRAHLISIVIPTVLGRPSIFRTLVIAIAALVGYGWIGFLDDYAKVTHQRNLGLTARRKLAYPVRDGVRIRRDSAGDAGLRPIIRRP